MAQTIWPWGCPTYNPSIYNTYYPVTKVTLTQLTNYASKISSSLFSLIFPELLQPFPLSLAQSDVRSDVFQTRGRKAKVGGHISSSMIRAVGKSKIRGEGASTNMVGTYIIYWLTDLPNSLVGMNITPTSPAPCSDSPSTDCGGLVRPLLLLSCWLSSFSMLNTQQQSLRLVSSSYAVLAFFAVLACKHYRQQSQAKKIRGGRNSCIQEFEIPMKSSFNLLSR